MKKWEYKIIDSRDVTGGGSFAGKDRLGVDQYLCSLGQEGWEVVTLEFREIENRFNFTGVAKRETSM